MHVNDKLLKYCEFYIESSIEHRVESIQIFIKTISHHVKVKIQLEIKCGHIILFILAASTLLFILGQ